MELAGSAGLVVAGHGLLDDAPVPADLPVAGGELLHPGEHQGRVRIDQAPHAAVDGP